MHPEYGEWIPFSWQDLYQYKKNLLRVLYVGSREEAVDRLEDCWLFLNNYWRIISLIKLIIYQYWLWKNGWALKWVKLWGWVQLVTVIDMIVIGRVKLIISGLYNTHLLKKAVYNVESFHWKVCMSFESHKPKIILKFPCEGQVQILLWKKRQRLLYV